jgi:predicted PurR-regulated permease PerM
MSEKIYPESWEFLWKLFFLVILGWILFLSRDIVAALLVAIVLSAAFDPAVSFLERKRIPRILGTLLVYLLTAFLIGFMVYTFIPIALSEVSGLLNAPPSITAEGGLPFGLDGVMEYLSASLGKFSELFSNSDASLIEIVSNFLGGVFIAIAIFVLSFYLTISRDGVERFLYAILPMAYERKAVEVYERVRRKIGKWLIGQFFVSLVVGLTTFLGLQFLGVRYSLFLGFLAAVAELIPYVGPIFTGGLAVVIALGQSPELALYVFILFLIIQQLENHILQPLVGRYTTSLNAVIVLLALLIGGSVFGIIGIILAVPVAVLIQEIIEQWVEVKQSRRGLSP